MEQESIISIARTAIEKQILAGQAPSVRSVAAALSMSPRSFQRRLGQAGTSHRSLVLRGRFDLARRLLVETLEPVNEISSRFGYADPSHFSRFFRRMTGMSPLAYRLQARRGTPGKRRAARGAPRALSTADSP